MNPVIAAFSALLAAFSVRPVVIVQATGAAPTPVTQAVVAFSTDTFTDSTTEWMTPAGTNSAIDTTEVNHEIIVLAGTVNELRVQLTGSVGGAGTAQFLMRKCPAGGGSCADTALNCTVGTGTSTCSDTSNSFSVANGDRLTMAITTGNVSNSVSPSFSWRWVGTNSNESMLIANYSGDSATVTECPTSSGNLGGAITCASVTGLALPAPENFTITGLYAKAAADIATGCRRIRAYGVFNGVGPAGDSTLQVDLSTGVQEASDTSGTLTFNTSSTPDYLTIEDDPGDTCGSTGTATTSQISFTFRLTNASQHFMNGACGLGAAPSPSATNYNWPVAAPSWNATEANRDAISVGFTNTGFAFRGDTNPTPGNFTFGLRHAVANGVTCNVATGATSCNGSGNVAVTDADMLAIASVPAASPGAGPSNWCLSWSGAGS